MLNDNTSYIEDETLVMKLPSFGRQDADELRMHIGKSIIELVQQRSEDFHDSEPIYYALEVVKACLEHEKPKF